MAQTDFGLAPKDGLVEGIVNSLLPEGMTLRTHIFAPLIDSSDVGPHHWNQILDLIEAAPDTAVLITHGTDTMSFTGAALSQALVGLHRRVVLCGSMVPLLMEGDAEPNLQLAIATAMCPGEGVFLSFAQRVMHAGGLVKHDSSMPDSFRPLPQAPLSPPKNRRFDDRRFAILSLSPGLPKVALQAALEQLDGAVLRIYGSGTAMSDPGILELLADATRQGKRLRAVSQCETGGLRPGTYAAGGGLWKAGVENGGLETSEAALIQLWLN
ncbi:aminopeptidase [Cohaesibacter celericrescens]|uniref:Aminopeptidase n=2 Tax=Cohaesibacter celericrescens TaxID=2067669 RepID=A0A2N5XNG8_9HYPH|nr:aminopeptidase [Cohaesibacter celericrescens]